MTLGHLIVGLVAGGIIGACASLLFGLGPWGGLGVFVVAANLAALLSMWRDGGRR